MNKKSSLSEGIPDHLPALQRACLLTGKASRLGFDWPTLDGVLRKLREEIKELQEALALKDRRKIREEIGDLLFVVANIARFLRIDPEEALDKTIEKFDSRFRYIETCLEKKGKSFSESSLLEMDRLWEEAKKKNRVT